MSRPKLQDSFDACRTYSHAWDRFNPIDMDAPWYGWRLSLRCLRCGSERHDNIAYGTGEIMGRRYIYAEGYQYKGEDTPKKEQFREALFEKLRADLKTSHGLGSEEAVPKKKSNVTPITAAKKRTSAKKVPGSRARKGA